MTAQELLKQSKPEEALVRLQNDIKQQPGDAGLRLGLFQLLAVNGQWSRAISQVQTAVSLDPKLARLAILLRSLVQQEQMRDAVFAGEQEPLVFGPTPNWLKTILKTFRKLDASFAKVHGQAMKEAPARSGWIDGRPFQWIADADARFGPSVELYLQGHYYWVPMECIARVDLDPPSDLQDLIWMQAKLTWVNGGSVVGHIPARYPASAQVGDPKLRLANSVEWNQIADGCFIGTGVRVLSTDDGDFPLTKVRRIEFGAAS